MENKIIEVLDYLCDKLGIAVDWTGENVVPQVMGVLSRYRIYAIVNDAIWLVISVVVLVATFCLFKKIYKQYKNEDGFFYDNEEEACVVTVIGVIVAAIFLFVAGFCFNATLKWAFIPEVKYLELLSEYLK